MKIQFYGSRGSIPTPLLLTDFQNKVKKIFSFLLMDMKIKKPIFYLTHQTTL